MIMNSPFNLIGLNVHIITEIVEGCKFIERFSKNLHDVFVTAADVIILNYYAWNLSLQNSLSSFPK